MLTLRQALNYALIYCLPIYPHLFTIFLLQFKQTPCTQTPIIDFADVLRFVQGQLHFCALAFSERICFTFKWRLAAFAPYYLMLLMNAHCGKIKKESRAFMSRLP